MSFRSFSPITSVTATYQSEGLLHAGTVPASRFPISFRFRAFLILLACSCLSLSCKPKLSNRESSDPKSTPPGDVSTSPFDDPAPPPPPPVETGRSQASITGLLVSTQTGADFIGEASRINATVLPVRYALEEMSVAFNQDVGKSMESALNEAKKFHLLRNPETQLNQYIEFAFEEQYSSKDGPSATVACTLLIESILTDLELNSDFAVTGDMNVDGTVQPVGGIDGKIRGATKGGCQMIAIPKENCTTLADLAVLGETTYFINIQIFSISTFAEAVELAKAESQRTPEVQASLKLFAEVQDLLRKPGGIKWIGNPHVNARLEKVLQTTPNHESARHLLLVGQKQTAAQLSLAGSFLQIYRATAPLRSALEEGIIPEDTSGISDSIFTLRKVRTRLDPRTRGCADALENFADTVKQIGETNLSAARSRVPKLVNQINEDWSRVLDEYQKIEADPEIQEELNL